MDIIALYAQLREAEKLYHEQKNQFIAQLQHYRAHGMEMKTLRELRISNRILAKLDPKPLCNDPQCAYHTNLPDLPDIDSIEKSYTQLKKTRSDIYSLQQQLAKELVKTLDSQQGVTLKSIVCACNDGHYDLGVYRLFMRLAKKNRKTLKHLPKEKREKRDYYIAELIRLGVSVQEISNITGLKEQQVIKIAKKPDPDSKEQYIKALQEL